MSFVMQTSNNSFSAANGANSGGTAQTPSGRGPGKQRLLDIFWDLTSRTSLLPPGGSSPADYLICPVSGEPMQSPMLLSCLHCVDESSLPVITVAEQRIVKCPVCAETTSVDVVSPHFALRRFIETVVNTNAGGDGLGKVLCPRHPNQELMFWDVTDSAAVCAYCLLLGPAKGHAHMTVADAQKIWRKELTRFLEDAGTQDGIYLDAERQVSDALERVDQQAEEANRHLTSQIDSLIELLQQRKRDLMYDAALAHTRARQPLLAVDAALKAAHNKLQTTTQQTYAAIQACPMDSLLQVRSVIDTRWMQVLSTWDSLQQTMAEALAGEEEPSNAVRFVPEPNNDVAASLESFGTILPSLTSAVSAPSSDAPYECSCVLSMHQPDANGQPQDVYLWPVCTTGASAVVTGDSAGDLHVVDGLGLTESAVHKAHTKTICSLISLNSMAAPDSLISTRDSCVASGGYDGCTRVWDVSTGECLLSLQVSLEPDQPVWSLAQVPFGSRPAIACGLNEGFVRFLDLSAGGAILADYKVSAVPNSRVLCAAHVPGTENVAFGTSDGQFVVLSLAQGIITEVSRVSCAGEAWCVCVAASGEFYIGESAGVIEVAMFSGKRLVIVSRIVCGQATIRTIIPASARTLWAAGVDCNIVVLWRQPVLQRAQQMGKRDVDPIVRVMEQAHASFIYGLAKLGSRIFSVGDDDALRAWDPRP